MITSSPVSSLAPWQKVTLAVAVALLIGYAFGRYGQPAKVQIQTQTVVKEVETVKHDTVTVTKEIKEPNGTVETDTVVTNKDVDTTQIQSDSKTTETITNQKPQWKLGVLGGYNLQDLRPDYGVSVDRRVLGPIFLGVIGHTDTTHSSVLLHLSMEF